MADSSVPDNSLYETPTARRAGAREAILCVLLAAAVLVLLAGTSVRSAGEEMNRGIVRDGRPRGRASRRAGSPIACRSRTPSSRPDERALVRRGPRVGAERLRRRRGQRGGRAAGHARRVRPLRARREAGAAGPAADAAGDRRLAQPAARRRARARPRRARRACASSATRGSGRASRSPTCSTGASSRSRRRARTAPTPS